ncbi:MAG: threonylcarbamoyl-AMP synthase [Candidatus Pacebacteria bacterium]|nr:threonylcarbamoyl-AMP synthase [Candidatus Paceibacterota bacterium]
MKEIILYPTETVYGLGVNAFDVDAWQQLCVLKGRSAAQTASWLVRDIADIERLGVMTEKARELIEQYLPGPLTLVLQASDLVPGHCKAEDGTVSFRLSSDHLAQQLIGEYMEKSGGVPLTCTSANVHGEPTLPTVTEILEQFGDRRKMITSVIDGGVRAGKSSTVVRCVGEDVVVLRQGEIKI